MKNLEYDLLEDLDIKRFYVAGKDFYVCGEETNEFGSVTRALKPLTEDIFKNWIAKIGKEEANRIVQEACTRGIIVHKLIEEYLCGNEEYFHDHRDTYETNKTHIGMLDATIEVLDGRLTKMLGYEHMLYSKELGLVGRADLIGVFDGKYSIVDFKTSNKLKKEEWNMQTYLQCAAYAIMVEEQYNIEVPQLVMLNIVSGEENENSLAETQLFVVESTPYKKLLRNFLKTGKLI